MIRRLILALAPALFLNACGVGLCAGNCELAEVDVDVDVDVEDNRTFADFTASLIHRDRSASQMTLQEEISGKQTSGTRKVPSITKDDDGGTGGSVTYATRPSQVCGTTQSVVADRITHCATLNGSAATWDGATQGNAGQAQWKLVTYNGTHEVWRDERTQYLWSDRLGQTNWCIAAGSSGAGPYPEVDPSGYCNNVTYQPNQSTPASWCTEGAGLDTPSGLDSMKGGMRLAATATSPSVAWRLPTILDFRQAEIDGIRFVLPGIDAIGFIYSATIYSLDRTNALVYRPSLAGGFAPTLRTTATHDIYCIGR